MNQDSKKFYENLLNPKRRRKPVGKEKAYLVALIIDTIHTVYAHNEAEAETIAHNDARAWISNFAKAPHIKTASIDSD